MGIAVCALIKHDLDTSGMEALAAQLAERLDGIVIYGYQDNWRANNRETPHDYVVKGYAGSNEKRILKMYCNGYFERLLNSDKEIWYEIYDLANDGGESLDIYKECFSPFAGYDSKWGGFCCTFMDETKREIWEPSVHDFRKQVLLEKQLLGVGELALYYGDNHMESAGAFDIALSGSWEDVISFIKKLGKKNIVIDIGSWFKNEPDYKSKLPIAFLDDFSYLPPDMRHLPK